MSDEDYSQTATLHLDTGEMVVPSIFDVSNSWRLALHISGWKDIPAEFACSTGYLLVAAKPPSGKGCSRHSSMLDILLGEAVIEKTTVFLTKFYATEFPRIRFHRLVLVP